MKPISITSIALVALLVIAIVQSASASEPRTVAPPRGPLLPFTFKHLCVRACDCGKPMCGISCRLPAFTCRDDYCPKPLPCVRLCWPKSCCDDYCPKPYPCWPPDPCDCRTVKSK
jgi:hypothetical protein